MVLFASLDGLDRDFFEKRVQCLPEEKQKWLIGVKNENAKRETILAWLLLRRALGLRRSETFPPLVFSERGKPRFEKEHIFFNLSHSGNTVCAAISQYGEIGVDVQKISAFSDKVKKRVFCSNELERAGSLTDADSYFTCLWTIKESRLKQNGVGIAFDLKSLDFADEAFKDYFKEDDLFYTVNKIDECFFSVCTKEEGKQKFESVPAICL